MFFSSFLRELCGYWIFLFCLREQNHGFPNQVGELRVGLTHSSEAGYPSITYFKKIHPNPPLKKEGTKKNSPFLKGTKSTTYPITISTTKLMDKKFRSG